MKKASLLCSLLLLFACSSDSDTGGDSGAGETQKFTLLVAPNEGGTVSTAGGSYTKGTTVTITATPNPDYLFDRWTGSVNSQENPLELTINKNENIEANFIKKQYELAVNIEGEGSVDEKLLESSKSYDAGSRVELTAVPAEDWQFEQWIIDDEVITENPLELVIDKAMSVDVKFALSGVTNSGVIDLGENLNPEDLTIITALGSYSVNADGSFEAGIESDVENQTFFIENQNEEVLYASFINEGSVNVNAESTVDVIFGLMPWSWSLSRQEIDAILAEFKTLSEYTELVSAVEQAVAQNESPLDNQNVLDAFERLFNNQIAQTIIQPEIPEVDNIVEPIIEFNSNEFTIKNDGTTSAVWGLKLKDFNTGQVLLEDVYLKPNSIGLPSVKSVFDYLFKEDSELIDVVYTPGAPLNINTNGENAYQINFLAPFTKDFENNSRITGYNTNVLSWNLFLLAKPFIELIPGLKKLNPSCVVEVANATLPKYGQLAVKYYNDEEITIGDFANEIYNEILETLKFLNCVSLEENKLKWLEKFTKVVDYYNKIDLVYKTSKGIVDMFLLSDIETCRQVVNGVAYPCSYLIDITEETVTSKAPGERILLEVDSKMYLAEEENASPGPIKINWEIIEGDGALQGNQTYTGELDGIAEIYYTLGSTENDIIRASIKNSSGEIIKMNGTEVKEDIRIERIPIDSIPIYEEAVLGSWTVTTLESQNNNNLVLYQGGTGKYIVDDDEYNISWEIVKRNGKYHLREYGFYHYGFEQYRTFDVTLPENFLTYPVSTFLTYTDFGDGPGSPGRRYSKS